MHRRHRTRKYRLHGGEEPSTVPMPNYPSPITVKPEDATAAVAKSSADQNQLNKMLAGGSKLKKKQTGGMGDIKICQTSLFNSADGWGYVPPVGCMTVPTVQDPMAQQLAINSAHISATGVANAQYDNKYGS
jgi:hypothetical protein